LGKTENACKLALMRLGDDPDAVLDSYRPKFQFNGQLFYTQQEMAEHIAPLTGRAPLTVLAKLSEFGGDAIRLVEHYRQLDDISGLGELAQELRTAQREAGFSRLDHLTVLSKNNDPYRFDNEAGRRDGQWFTDLFNKLVPRGAKHLRGFHYVLVSSRGIIKPDGTPYRNNDADWLWLMHEASGAARWLGMLPFERIVDERNDPPVPPDDDDFDPAGMSQALIDGLGGDVPNLDGAMPSIAFSHRPHRQPYRIVLWGEKSSLGDALEPVRSMVNGEMLLPSGESTATMVFNMAQRIVEDGRPAVIGYFNDFDPAGWQMAISVARKLQALKTLRFPTLNVRLYPVALNIEQVTRLNLPSTPLKPEEKRADKWREAWGREQTEIDALAALNPTELGRMARDFVRPFFDPTLAERTDAVVRFTQRVAQDALASHPQYTAIREAISGALANLEAANEALLAVQDQAMRDMDDIELPPLPELPEPVIEDAAPKPLFTTEDDYTTATLKLKEHRALYPDDEDTD
jgi:hypothetical protein